MHGVGLKNIDYVVSKYDGMIVHECKIMVKKNSKIRMITIGLEIIRKDKDE